MEDKEEAMALVEKHQFSGMFKQNAIEHSKLDLQHSIELLGEVKLSGEFNEFGILSLNRRIKSLRNQLEHLNSI